MANINLEITFDSVNVSAQPGDIVYYTIPPVGGQVGGFDSAQLSSTRFLGIIYSIDDLKVTVQYNPQVSSPPPAGSFMSFAKDKKINTSSLLGYYASVKFVNDSTDKIELFSIGSEISESSK
tara:strand:+ start:425 stop:790 length:366 start_codon:yes stop_codon:yes gene_type:complete